MLDRPMTLHFLMQGTGYTGGRAILIDHAAELLRRGHRVNVYVTGRDSSTIDWAPAQMPVHPLPHIPDLPAGDACVFERPSLAADVLKYFCGIPIQFVQGFEGTDAALRRDAALSRYRLLEYLRLRAKVRRIDRAYRLPTTKFVVHPHLAGLISERFGQSTTWVPNGLPDGVFKPAANRSWNGQTVLVVGPTDTPSKRIVDALRAAVIAKRQAPGMQLIRVAQHPMRPIEQSLGVTDAYHTMLKPVEMAALYHQVDLVLLPYNSAEGFGLPAIEAMASGTPTILTDIPAFRTFDRPDDYAKFVPAGKVEEMAGAVIALLSDPAARQRLSRRGLEVAALYTRQRSHDAMEAALRQVIHHGR